MSGYTPGPWFVADGDGEDDECGIGTKPGQFDIAQMVWRHDARLIAAAPELLDALKYLTLRYIALIREAGCYRWNPETDSEVVNARAAIAKAEG